ncbi:hypothetical protein, partial [Azospirillum brasilense]
MSVPSALSEALPDLLPVLRVFGALLAMFSWALAVPLGASLWAGEGLWPVYAASLGFALACGVA